MRHVLGWTSMALVGALGCRADIPNASRTHDNAAADDTIVRASDTSVTEIREWLGAWEDLGQPGIEPASWDCGLIGNNACTPEQLAAALPLSHSLRQALERSGRQSHGVRMHEYVFQRGGIPFFPGLSVLDVRPTIFLPESTAGTREEAQTHLRKQVHRALNDSSGGRSAHGIAAASVFPTVHRREGKPACLSLSYYLHPSVTEFTADIILDQPDAQMRPSSQGQLDDVFWLENLPSGDLRGRVPWAVDVMKSRLIPADGSVPGSSAIADALINEHKAPDDAGGRANRGAPHSAAAASDSASNEAGGRGASDGAGNNGVGNNGAGNNGGGSGASNGGGGNGSGDGGSGDGGSGNSSAGNSSAGNGSAGNSSAGNSSAGNSGTPSRSKTEGGSKGGSQGAGAALRAAGDALPPSIQRSWGPDHLYRAEHVLLVTKANRRGINSLQSLPMRHQASWGIHCPQGAGCRYLEGDELAKDATCPPVRQIKALPE